MPSIIQGRIVYPIDPIPDPQGKNPKPNRPFVVISTPDEIKSGASLTVIGISSTVRNDSDEVELPYGPICRTGLHRRSVAICSWKKSVEQSRVEVGRGFVRPVQLKEILLKARGE